jgi:hypothetical protein
MSAATDVASMPLFPLARLPDCAGADGELILPHRGYDWARKGLCGIRLPTIWIGGRRYVTQAAYLNWLIQVDAAKREKAPRE